VFAGCMEGLQAAQEVPTLAGLCHRHTEELEELLPSQVSGSYDSSNSLERVQTEEPLQQNARNGDAVTGHSQGIPGSTWVS